MIRLFVLLAFAAPALAQTAVLGGWGLPEGAVVESSSVTEYEGELDAPEGAVPMQMRHVDRERWTIDAVEDGRLVRYTDTTVASERKTLVDGRLLPAGPASQGWTTTAAWSGAEWQRVAEDGALSGAVRPPEGLIDPEYPERPLSVGETVEVDAATIREVYRNVLDGDHRLTIRLDSLGTHEGGPAAFLTQEVDAVIDAGGAEMHMTMTARIVRRLDWKLDVRTEWEGPVTTDYGAGAMTGPMRYVSVLGVTLPD